MKTPIPFTSLLLLPAVTTYADGPGKADAGVIITPKPQPKILPAPASRSVSAPEPDGSPSPAVRPL